MIRVFTVSASMILCCHLVSTAGAERLTYEHDIRPIFRAHCFDCHGASEEIEGELDLRLVRLMIRGGDSGPAIVASKPDESLLVDRIRSGDMPPGPSHLSDQEIDTIERWIASGSKTARPEPAKIGPGLGITPEERSFWSFQPIHRPALPVLTKRDESLEIEEPIDFFVIANGHEIATQADRRTLVIRAYFDLIGLPPTPAELQDWIEEPSDKWFDHLLDTLLASPHYGERWGRHWLDIAGYADSEGYSAADTERPWSWKYRDWVIRALNDDKPFDQFLTEQLAGDELAGPISGDLTANQIGLLTATGFLRMAADGTGSGANNSEGRNQVMIDTLQIVGTSLFGLSLQCAQCHDHRYDPIPQSDYYAMRAIFEPAIDWKAWKPPAQRLISLYTASDRQKAAEVEAEAQELAKTKAQELAEYMQQALNQELMKYDQPLRDQLKVAYQTAVAERNDEQKQILAKHPSVNITSGNLYQYIPDSKPKLAEFDKQIQQIRSKKPIQEFIRALVEPPSHQPETRLFHRGDFQQPKQLISPAAFTVTSEPGQQAVFASDNEQLTTSGRRLAFARWITSRDNPLLARVIANRLWMHHFGTGIVATPADFGKLGARPSNLPLLDWLADELMVQGWSLKTLHRTIMSSATWRQQVLDASQKDYASRRLRRLEAETIRDRMLVTTGRLDPKLFGRPIQLKEDDTGQIVVEKPQKRRSLYLQVRRSRPVAMMSSFDAPTMETNCEIRSSSTVATQSLMMLNGRFILERAIEFANRVAAEELDAESLSTLPAFDFPKPLSDSWQYGFGSYAQDIERTESFTPLSHWNNNQWQAGPALPDPKRGWVLLNAQGGHPGGPTHAVVRRWTAQATGSIKIDGKLSHPSAAGDGVRGRIISSSTGILGEWMAKSNSTNTSVSTDVNTGDTIDFITDCQSNHTSDSFSWPVTMTFSDNDQTMIYSSVDQFSGPSDPVAMIPSQIIRVWELAYCRRPTEAEYRAGCQFIAQQLSTFRSNPTAIPQGRTAIQQAMTNLCQSVLSSNEFLYVE